MTGEALSVPRRNGLAVEQALARMAEAILRATQRVDALNAAVGSLSERLLLLEEDAARRRIDEMGHGPTVR